MNDEDHGLTAAPLDPLAGMRAIKSSANNAGAVAIESERAIAEARGQMQLAKMFPRDTATAYAELMEACKNYDFALEAFYAVPRGAGKVTGLSIRSAEEIARCYGNFEYGHRELSRGADKTEVMVYAWDKERNNQSVRQITVMHVIDTKEGPRKLRDQKDIDDKIANVASKQVRGRILALVPKYFVAAAKRVLTETLAAKGGTLSLTERMNKMVEAFSAFGIKSKNIADRIGHPLENITPDDFADLQGVFTALQDGGKVEDYFELTAKDSKSTGESIAKLVASAPPPPPAAPPPPPPKPTTRKAPPAAPPAEVESSPPAPAPAPTPPAPAPSADNNDDPPEDLF